MSSENIVEKEIDSSNPPMEPNLHHTDGDSNAISSETSATVTDLVLMAKTPQERERALKKMLNQTEASEAASNDPAIQPFAAGNYGNLYTQHGVLVLDPTVQRERELLALLTKAQKPKSVSEVEKEKAEKEKTEKKKAEHKRYKAKKKAEAAAKRKAEKEAAEEAAEQAAEEEAEVPESSISQAELQAEEDARLGEKRIRLQIARQERLDEVASLVNAKMDSSRAFDLAKERVLSEGRKK